MSTINNELKNIISNHRLVNNESAAKNRKNITAGDNEFQNIINRPFDSEQKSDGSVRDLELSLHAQKRMEQRSIQLDGQEYAKLKQALQSLENKGGRESLVVTEKAAYIMDVANKKIVTAMNKEELRQNVFTKIDSTVFV